MKTKATPRPWKAPFIDENDADVISITDEDQMFGICVCREYSCESKEQMKANAELIVRAVNCHDELVQALKDLLENTVAKDDQSHWAINNAAQTYQRARGES
jgi:hypothetical protein